MSKLTIEEFEKGEYVVLGTTSKTDNTIKALLKEAGAKYNSKHRDGPAWYFKKVSYSKVEKAVKKANEIIKHNRKILDSSDSEDKSREVKRRLNSGTTKGKTRVSSDNDSEDERPTSRTNKKKTSESSNSEDIFRKIKSGSRTAKGKKTRASSSSDSGDERRRTNKRKDDSDEDNILPPPSRKPVPIYIPSTNQDKSGSAIKKQSDSSSSSSDKSRSGKRKGRKTTGAMEDQDNPEIIPRDERTSPSTEGSKVVENKLHTFHPHSEKSLVGDDGIVYRAYMYFLPELHKNGKVEIDGNRYVVTGVVIDGDIQVVPENNEEGVFVLVSVVNGEYKIITAEGCKPVRVIRE